jgi:hypothetical protein
MPPLRRPRRFARGAAASSCPPSSSRTMGQEPINATSARRTTRTTTGVGSPETGTSTRAEYDLAVANSLSESAWQAQIVSLAKTLGLLCYHTLDSRGSERGFPDLTILGHGRMLLLELKRQSRKSVLTTEQVEWLDGAARLRDSGNSGVEVYVARPLVRDALVTTLYQGKDAKGALHQWCLRDDCQTCNDERSRAKISLPSRRRRRQSPPK